MCHSGCACTANETDLFACAVASSLRLACVTLHACPRVRDRCRTSQYDGTLKAGKFDGHGTYEFPGGMKYVGQFKMGYFHGDGVIYHKHGSYRCKFDMGKVSRAYARGCACMFANGAATCPMPSTSGS